MYFRKSHLLLNNEPVRILINGTNFITSVTL